MNATDFCTCQNKECNLNPVNHDQGCDLCIKVNLECNTIPRCFFHKVMGDDVSKIKNWSFEEFATEVELHKDK